MSGINILYKELCSIVVQQLFYENKVCPRYSAQPVTDLALLPTAETQALLKRLGLVMRTNDGTGTTTILAEVSGTSGGNNLLRYAPLPGDKLIFWLQAKNPYLFNFNQLPVKANLASTLYLTNNQADTLAPRDNLHLTQSNTGVSAADEVEKTAYTFRYQHTAVSNNIEVVHLLAAITVLPTSMTNANGKTDAVFNLGSLPTGMCRLLVDNMTIKDFYYAGVGATQNILAAVEIILTPGLAGAYSITEAGGRALLPDRPRYTIVFANRSTLWRYTITISPTSPLYEELQADSVTFLNNFKITTNDNNITFTQAAATNNVVTFLSDSPVLLREKYISATDMKPLSIALKKNGTTTVRDNLPHAPVSSIDVTNFPIVYSDILLTL
jgi:hypothetical protein